MELKLHAGSVKTLDVKGEGQAIIAQLDTIDLDGDVTLAGAFGEQTSPMVPAHDWNQAPIGKARIHEENQYAIADFQMNLATSLGKDWYESLKFDMAHPPPKQEYSYGYTAKEYNFGEKDGQRVRFLKSVQVHEVSPVLLGAGIGTRTLGLKDSSNPTGFVLKQAIAAKAKLIGKTQFELTDELAKKSSVEQAIVYQVIAGDLDPFTLPQFPSAVQDILGVSLSQFRAAAEQPLKQKDATPVPCHAVQADDGIWDGPGSERKVSNGETQSYYRRIFAWQDPNSEPAAKTSWRFCHHLVDTSGNPGKASIKACLMGIAVLNGARTGCTIPDADRRSVWDHLAKHLEDADVTPPVLRQAGEIDRKLVDQINFLKWDAEACIERLIEVREMRAKEGRNLPEDRVDQITGFKELIVSLDNLIARPILDGQTVDIVQGYNALRKRKIALDQI